MTKEKETVAVKETISPEEAEKILIEDRKNRHERVMEFVKEYLIKEGVEYVIGVQANSLGGARFEMTLRDIPANNNGNGQAQA